MARGIDEIVRDTLGNQAIEIIRLVAEIEALKERITELENANSASTPTV